MAKRVIVSEVIDGKILLARGHKVIVDFHLAARCGNKSTETCCETESGKISFGFLL
jgi:hypothetical protein